MSNYCKNCGNKLDKDDKYCGKCGTQVSDQQDSSLKKKEISTNTQKKLPKPTNFKPIAFLIILTLIVISAVTGITITNNVRRDNDLQRQSASYSQELQIEKEESILKSRKEEKENKKELENIRESIRRDKLTPSERLIEDDKRAKEKDR